MFNSNGRQISDPPNMSPPGPDVVWCGECEGEHHEPECLPELLHVEDDKTIARAFGRVFRERFKVHHATSVASAWPYLEALNVRFVILDREVEDGHTGELYARCKERGLTVLVHSGSARTPDVLEEDYAHKSTTASALITLLEIKEEDAND